MKTEVVANDRTQHNNMIVVLTPVHFGQTNGASPGTELYLAILFCSLCQKMPEFLLKVGLSTVEDGLQLQIFGISWCQAVVPANYLCDVDGGLSGTERRAEAR
ncbi:MAG: hypothetical protein ACJ71Q_05440 [Terriglobales bacterium]|jgi:hypothetical protein